MSQHDMDSSPPLAAEDDFFLALCNAFQLYWEHDESTPGLSSSASSVQGSDTVLTPAPSSPTAQVQVEIADEYDTNFTLDKEQQSCLAEKILAVDSISQIEEAASSSLDSPQPAVENDTKSVNDAPGDSTDPTNDTASATADGPAAAVDQEVVDVQEVAATDEEPGSAADGGLYSDLNETDAFGELLKALEPLILELNSEESAQVSGSDEPDKEKSDEEKTEEDEPDAEKPDEDKPEEEKPEENTEGNEASRDGESPSDESAEATEEEPEIDLESIRDDSAARLEWIRQKKDEGAKNKHLDKMMSMIGLEEIKAQCLRIKARVDTAKRQDVSLSKERYNFAFTGNPGTGKTTVATIFAHYLISIGAVPGDGLKVKTGRWVRNVDGIDGLKTTLSSLSSGGVFVIDEAHQLADSDRTMEFLLGEMEKHVGKIAFIFCGLRTEMDSFLGYCPSLESRVPYRVTFRDYTNDELLRILVYTLKDRFGDKIKVEDGDEGLYSRILVRRVARGRGSDNFGNARAIENAFARVCERQAERLRNERITSKDVDDFVFTKEDMIGPEPSDVLERSAAWKELQGLVGLGDVKDALQGFMDRVYVNYHRELQEKDPIEVSLNQVFLGPPGTGKTTVGKLYGQVLAELGLLSKGEVVTKNPSDFIGAYIGWSERQTKEILSSAKGKVLIIDEAYMLYPGSRSGGCSKSDVFRIAVIDTLVAEIQSCPGEDRAVILMGYEEPMREMFHHANPGLARRFPLEQAFMFSDFNDAELGTILDMKLAKQKIETTAEARKVCVELLSRARDRPNFGNGGDVENLVSRAKASYQQRMATLPMASRPQSMILEPFDFDANYDRARNATENCRQLFKGVVGCEDIIQQFQSYQLTAAGMRKHNIDPRPHIPFTFVFTGAPGTGKTTTARKIGQVFYDMGFLSSPKVFECSASDLVAQHTGQTGPKVVDLLERSLGHVLFIDEAYRLAEGHFSQEAIDELVDSITKPRFAHKIIIILAGYKEDINRLLMVNRGLSSRFATEIFFKSLGPEECLSLLKQRISQFGISLPDTYHPKGREQLLSGFERLATTASWANGRDVETLGKRVIGAVFKEVALSGGSLVATVEQVLKEQLAMLDERKRRVGSLQAGKHYGHFKN